MIQKCGFVAVLGAPNAGKSTLVNHMVGAKISIVSPKVQTTRCRVRGIVMRGETQIVMIDVPGIFKPKDRLDKAMVAAAWEGANDSDLCLVMIDAQKGIDSNTSLILDNLTKHKKRVTLVINKIDLIDKQKLLPLVAKLQSYPIFDETFFISATNGQNTDELTNYIISKMPQQPWMFNEDDLSDLPNRLFAAEITREKLFLNLQAELPYSLTVETNTWEEKTDGSIKIEQTIYIKRESQKAIIVGQNGQMIKKIGATARFELTKILDREVHLFLFVKVRENWVNDPSRYQEWGLNFNA